MKTNIVLAALVVAAGAVHATTLPIVIEKLSTAAIRCGLSEPQLENVARRTLDASRYQPDAGADGWLHVRVKANPARRGVCAARVSVQMKASAKPPPADGKPGTKQRARAPVVVLCNKSGDSSVPTGSFPAEIESSIDYSIRQCLGSLKY